MYIHVGKGGALNRGLKLFKQLIRVFECISERHIRQRVEVDDMQCRFISAIQKLHLISNKPFYITFINIENGSR